MRPSVCVITCLSFSLTLNLIVTFWSHWNAWKLQWARRNSTAPHVEGDPEQYRPYNIHLHGVATLVRDGDSLARRKATLNAADVERCHRHSLHVTPGLHNRESDIECWESLC